MPSKSKRQRSNRVKPEASTTRAMHSVDGELHANETWNPEALRPEDRQKCFEKARRWQRDHWFVRTVLYLRRVFFNFGFQLKAESKGDQKKIDAWLSNKANKKALHGYTRELWDEWLTLDVAISFWRNSAQR